MTRESDSISHTRAVIREPGPNRRPFTKEVRVPLTEQQHAYLHTLKGGDQLAAFVRDRLFYAAPGEGPHVAAIGEVFLAAGQTAAAAQELQFQIDKFARTIRSLATIVRRSPTGWDKLPDVALWPYLPVDEQAQRLAASAERLLSLAEAMANEHMGRLLGGKRPAPIQRRPRPRK